jgi:hypothetical protein
MRGRGAEILQKRRECRNLRPERDHAVMISGERDDRRRIIAVRLIELVVIILRLAEL